MEFAGFNPYAVLVAAIAGFVFSAIWYNVLARQWVAAVGQTEDEIKSATSTMPVLLVTAFIAQLTMAFVLSGVIGHLGSGQVTLKNGLISGAILWVGFILTTMCVNDSFQGQSKNLTLINSGNWLGVLLLQGAIIGIMGVSA